MLVFQNRLQYRNSDFKRLNGTNLSAFCRNLVRFGPVTPVYNVKMTTLAAIWHITPNISEYPGPIFTKFTDLIGMWEEFNLKFISWSPREH